ncbi:MAG: hypothetical protein KDA74_16620, partial [Planctomycetaceae bacterium]|nr:hypothetical protein [Planctomycetaceae bacterium]
PPLLFIRLVACISDASEFELLNVGDPCCGGFVGVGAPATRRNRLDDVLISQCHVGINRVFDVFGYRVAGLADD